MGGVRAAASVESTAKPWHISQPALVADVCAALADYPTLHLFLTESKAEIRGTFPVRDEAGRTLDEYSVSIELPPRYPSSLPIVRETGGRIPQTLKRHVLSTNGACCVLLPDARWEEFPVGAPFAEFLAGPLRNYFLGQSVVELGGEWPFGEWAHGNEARLDYYCGLFGTRRIATVRQFLEAIAWPHRKGRVECPCGSGRRLHKCCRAKVHDLRTKLPRETARDAFSALGFRRRGRAQRSGQSRSQNRRR